jgi:phospholipase C
VRDAITGGAGLPHPHTRQTPRRFDGSALPLFSLAREYTLAGRFFHAAFGGALLNHFWLICACTPRYNDAPENLLAQLDADGRMIKDGSVTPNGYAVNTIDPVSEPHDPKIADDRQFLPSQTMLSSDT